MSQYTFFLKLCVYTSNCQLDLLFNALSIINPSKRSKLMPLAFASSGRSDQFGVNPASGFT